MYEGEKVEKFILGDSIIPKHRSCISTCSQNFTKNSKTLDFSEIAKKNTKISFIFAVF